MPSVLLTRPRHLSEHLAADLSRDGWTVYQAPMLHYADTGTALPDLSVYDALVFTSAEAIRAFERQKGRTDIMAYAVGTATAAAAKEAGFKSITTANGDITSLNAAIDRDQRLLHISGYDIAGEIAGNKTDRHIIYKAELVQTMPDTVTDALRQGKIDAVLFFSPRSAAQFSAVLRENGLEHCAKHMNAFCFSDAVAAALASLSFRKLEVAEKIELSSIVALLNHSKK